MAYGYEKDIDYKTLMENAAKSGDMARAAIFEAQNNERINGEGLPVQQTSLYSQYLPAQQNVNPYQQELEKTMNGATVDYLLGGDAISAYKKAYLREADRTGRDTLGQYATMTGGIPSTQAVAAASQAADYQKSKLAEQLPSLYQQQIDAAMNRWKELGAADERVAQILGVPLYEFSHQQGHIAASLWSAGRLDLMRQPHLAWHLSGGTTELLRVEPDGKNVKAERIGGTSDISAGQLIDRTGKLLSLPFPAGKAVDALSRESDCRERYRVKLNGLEFSFSGIQNKAEAFYSGTQSPADTARFVLNCVVTCIADATRAAQRTCPGLPVVFSGGVASNSMLRERMREFAPVFAAPQYSTDNAMGVAVLAALQEGL